MWPQSHMYGIYVLAYITFLGDSLSRYLPSLRYLPLFRCGKVKTRFHVWSPNLYTHIITRHTHSYIHTPRYPHIRARHTRFSTAPHTISQHRRINSAQSVAVSGTLKTYTLNTTRFHFQLAGHTVDNKYPTHISLYTSIYEIWSSAHIAISVRRAWTTQ